MDFLIVTGMHRSGTSCIAAELAEAGLPISPTLLSADSGNPKGYFEDPALIGLHEAMLSALGSNWMDPTPFPEGWKDRLLNQGFGQQLNAYLDRFRGGSGHFVIKEPRIARLLPVWQQVAETAGDRLSVLRVFRNPFDVAHSLWRRNNIPPAHAIQIWARQNMDLLASLGDMPCARIAFEAFLDEPGHLAVATAALGIDLPQPGRLGSFSDPALRQTSIPETMAPQIPPALDLSGWNEPAHDTAEFYAQAYAACGGDVQALERRHYAVVHSTLWTVLEELKTARAFCDRYQAWLEGAPHP